MNLATKVLFLLVLAGGPLSGLASAGEKLHRIYQFAGLNTVAGDFSLKPGESRKAHNIDWGCNVGSVTKRFGHDSVSYYANQDSVVAIEGVYLSDGRQYLIMVTDSSGVGRGNVYASPYGEAQFTGVQSFEFAVHAAYNNYTYIDSFFFSGDTVVISYTSDADATGPEIISAFVDLIDTTTALDGYFTERGIPFVGYSATEAVEFLGASVASDTGQTITTTSPATSRIWTDFAILNKPSFASFGDVLFGVNGSHKGIAYNGDVCRSWPLSAPGEPTIVPLDTEGGADGEYKYAFTYLRGLEAADSSYGTIGTVTTPVRVSNGQILLKDFQWVGADTVDATPDSVGIVVYRTRANPGRLDQRDYAFLIDTIWGTSASNLATKTLIDSIADEALSDSISIWVDDFVGRDSVWGYDHRYGAPTFLEINSVLAYDSASDTTVAAGVYHGIPDQIDTLGVQYICTFIDTVLGIESNASPPLAIMQADTCVKARWHTIGLPAPVDGDSGIVRNLYRAHILQVTRDSAFNILDSTLTANGDGWVANAFRGVQEELTWWGWTNRLAEDTIVLSEYRLVAQVSLDSSAYTDSIRWDSLYLQPLYAQSTPPPFMTQIFAHDGRMFGIAGSRLYMSRFDSAAAWGARDYVSLDESDGDQITTAFVSRGVIRVLKNHSSFNVFQDANLQWDRREVSGYWGCIAPYSHAAGPLGHYYLSDRGVIRESEGQFIERTQAVELVSAPLDNFTVLPITTLDDATGFYFDQKYMLCIGDTTYVYDERSKAWATWSMTFADATLYGTEDELNFLPGDSMYFIKSGESNLYRYGTSELDNGSTFPVQWRSGPLFIDAPLYKHINSVELAFTNTDADDSITVYFYDETGSAVTAISPDAYTPNVLVFDTLQDRYQRISLLSHTPCRYYELELRNNAFGANSDAVIDLIDIWYTEGLKPEIK